MVDQSLEVQCSIVTEVVLGGKLEKSAPARDLCRKERQVGGIS